MHIKEIVGDGKVYEVSIWDGWKVLKNSSKPNIRVLLEEGTLKAGFCMLVVVQVVVITVPCSL